jgi:hypothetical protein
VNRLAGAVLVLAVAACQAVGGVVSPSDMTLSVLNSTTVAVVLVVNGTGVTDLMPGAQADVSAGKLPSLPWSAEVRLRSGRTLLSLTVKAGDVVRDPSSQKGDATRVDLSCGRIDLWSGPPLNGPVPGPGTPGDCDP